MSKVPSNESRQGRLVINDIRYQVTRASGWSWQWKIVSIDLLWGFKIILNVERFYGEKFWIKVFKSFKLFQQFFSYPNKKAFISLKKLSHLFFF